MRYSAWASRSAPTIPDPLEEMARLCESSRETSRANLAALAARRAMMDQVGETGAGRSYPPPTSQPPEPTHRSEGSHEPPRNVINVTRRTHGGAFGRSVVDRVAESYDR